MISHHLTPILCAGLICLGSCAVPTPEAANPPGTPAPTVSHTPVPKITEAPPTKEEEPIMTVTPSPWEVIPEATAAPPTEYFVKVEPTTVCLGDTLTFSAHLPEAGAKSLFLEKDLNREGKVPYFAGPYALVQRFDTKENADIHYTFALTDPMPDAEAQKTLAIQPGKYLLHLVHDDGEITGVDYITVTECHGS